MFDFFLRNAYNFLIIFCDVRGKNKEDALTLENKLNDGMSRYYSIIFKWTLIKF